MNGLRILVVPFEIILLTAGLFHFPNRGRNPHMISRISPQKDEPILS